jgi:hypothetical protein
MSPPTIIEIFQSQGCSFCPPTYSNLLTFTTQNPACLLLTYHVTYWDYIGWKDTFGQKVFTDRQHDYVKRLGVRSAYTPQIVVSGRESGVVRGMDELQDLVEKGKKTKESSPSGVGLEVDDSGADEEATIVTVSRGNVEGDLDLWLVKYDPRTVEVQITAGENAGRNLPHRNVVKDIQRIGFFSVEEADGSYFVEVARKDNLGYVVLVQQGEGGLIVGFTPL